LDTINPELVITASEVLSETQNANEIIADKVSEILEKSASIKQVAKVDVKAEMKQALVSKKETEALKTFASRERTRKDLLAANLEITPLVEKPKTISKIAAKGADTIIETDFQEIGVSKNDPSFK
jgi:predicted house-cleaning noncanonical NTP pyrophosphatase (MazG superfamily)